MKNLESNILAEFVIIINIEKCLKDINQQSETNSSWPNQEIRNKSCEKEWNRYEYLPKNGDIGEVIAKLNTNLYGESILIIRTFGMFYVPIFISGFEKYDVSSFYI